MTNKRDDDGNTLSQQCCDAQEMPWLDGLFWSAANQPGNGWWSAAAIQLSDRWSRSTSKTF